MVNAVLRGRGAVSNPRHRFETAPREAFDDGWGELGLADPPRPETVIFIERSRSAIVRNESPDIAFDQSVNPYRGCEHGCVYCYARPNHAYVGLSPGLDFETKIGVKPDCAELLAKELARPSYRCSPINIGSVTDCYQPLERKHRITRELIRLLHDCSHPLTLTTKSALIERDIDLLAPMAAAGLVGVFITLTSLDPKLARVLEPRAAAPWRRLQAIEKLANAGIPVAVSVAPIIPFVNEPEIEAILKAAHDAGARRAHYVLLRLPFELKEVFADWLHAHYPQRAQRVLNRLRDMRLGQLNDPRFGQRMKGQGIFAELIRQRFVRARRQLGMDGPAPPIRCDLFVAPRRLAQKDLQPSLF